MAGFEVVVRPVVFPDIRPAPAQPVPPADDPEQGFATIHGNGARQVSETVSFSSSASTSQRTEIQRRVDEVRIYQQEDDGTVNKKNFVDVEVANKIWMKGPPRPEVTEKSSDPIPPGYEQKFSPEENVYYLVRIKEKDNIEIRRKDVIRKEGED